MFGRTVCNHKKNHVFVFANPMYNYSRQVTFLFEESTLSPPAPKNGFQSQPHLRLWQTRSPFERRPVARKNGGASMEKKIWEMRNLTLNHSNPPVPLKNRSQILFAVAYVYLFAAFVVIHTCI